MKLQTIIYNKFCLWVDKTTPVQKIFTVYKFIALLSILLMLLFPRKAMYRFQFNSFLIMKVFASFTFIFFVEDIARFLLSISVKKYKKPNIAITKSDEPEPKKLF